MNTTSKILGCYLMAVLAGQLTAKTKTSSSNIVTIDWTKSDGGIGEPPTVNRPTDFAIVVVNVNDILYQYEVNVVAATIATDDFANLQSLLVKAASGPSGQGALAPVPGCLATEMTSLQKRYDDLVSALKAAPALNPKLSGTNYESIPVALTSQAWIGIGPLPTLTALSADVSASTCKPALLTLSDAINKLIVPVTTINARVTASTHSTSPTPVHLGPGQQLKVTVNEYFTPLIPIAAPAAGGTSSTVPISRAITTNNGKLFTITPTSNIMTLSAGFMATSIGARTYVARPVPGQTQTILAVDNNSKWRPAGVALLNYEIPYCSVGDFSCALSAGPIVAFGSGDANVSSLGFFGGISGSLYHRLYITPGFQLGQFSDFPAGLEKGSLIPANFGTPVALNRWTIRFAVGITFQTTSFAKLSGQTTVSPAAAGQAKTTK